MKKIIGWLLITVFTLSRVYIDFNYVSIIDVFYVDLLYIFLFPILLMATFGKVLTIRDVFFYCFYSEVIYNIVFYIFDPHIFDEVVIDISVAGRILVFVLMVICGLIVRWLTRKLVVLLRPTNN